VGRLANAKSNALSRSVDDSRVTLIRLADRISQGDGPEVSLPRYDPGSSTGGFLHSGGQERGRCMPARAPPALGGRPKGGGVGEAPRRGAANVLPPTIYFDGFGCGHLIGTAPPPGAGLVPGAFFPPGESPMS
jgi:hypothetical protein